MTITFRGFDQKYRFECQTWTCPTNGRFDSESKAATASNTRTTDPLAAELVEALNGYLDICPAFRSKPMGAPGSNARHNQTMHIGLEDRVKTLLSRVKEGK